MQNEMENYDVIIIGAGPAGLKCAEVLNNTNLKVLIIDRNKELGDKVCAGGLTIKGLKYLNLPKDLIEFKSSRILLHNSKNKFVIKNKSGEDYIFTINRKNLAKWQFEKIQNSKNICFLKETNVLEIHSDFIVTDKGSFKFNILVGADGSNSKVRKHVGLKSLNTLVAFQYILPVKYFDVEVFYTPKLFKAEYLWIFPYKNTTSIGCGCDIRKMSFDQALNNFKKFIKSHNIDVSNAKYQSFVINCDYQGYKFGNKYLIGDAGGFASLLTGEGIYQAIISGEEIGRKILNPDYKLSKLKKIIRHNKRHWWVFNQFNKFCFLIDYFIVIGNFLMKIYWLNQKIIKFFA
jgi:flavin-dependent dehydrogenase